MSDALKSHVPCNDCGSSDALTIYKDGHTYCYACETVHWNKNNTDNRNNNENVYKMETNLRPKPFRGLFEDTVKFLEL